MKRVITTVLLFLAGCLFAQPTFANALYNRAPGFQTPHGIIRFLGCYDQPLRIYQTGSNTKFLDLNPSVFNINTLYFPDKAQVVNETNFALVQKASDVGLSFEATLFNEAYQNALLLHILSPEKYRYHPRITAFCGDRPYALVGLIDYYGDSYCSVDIREKSAGNPILYWGKRSILEKDISLLSAKGKQMVVALELFLVSTRDGSLLWQGNMISTANGLVNYHEIAEGLLENALRDLMKP